MPTPVGPNNAGKSNLLEALRRVLGTSWVSVSSFAPEDVYRHDPNRDIEISCTMDTPVQYQRFKNATVTEIHGLSFEYTRYKIGEKRGQHRLEQRCKNANGEPRVSIFIRSLRGLREPRPQLVQRREVNLRLNRKSATPIPGAIEQLQRQLDEFRSICACPPHGIHDPE